MSILTPILPAILLVALLILNNSENQNCSPGGVVAGITLEEYRPTSESINQPLFHRGSGRRTPCLS